MLSYFIDLQGSQTRQSFSCALYRLSYFIDLQGSQTSYCCDVSSSSLVTLLIYKVLKQVIDKITRVESLVTLLIYKVLKHV